MEGAARMGVEVEGPNPLPSVRRIVGESLRVEKTQRKREREQKRNRCVRISPKKATTWVGIFNLLLPLENVIFFSSLPSLSSSFVHGVLRSCQFGFTYGLILLALSLFF